MALGWIYVLSSESLPGLVKIGQSSNDPSMRAAELYTTGVPSPFKVEYKGLFDNYARLERAVHVTLADFRHSGKREFFSVSIETAISAIRAVAGELPKYEKVTTSCAGAFTAATQSEEWVPTTPLPHIKVRRMRGAQRLIQEASRILKNPNSQFGG